MCGVCIRYCFHENEVWDVLQEGFLKVFSKIHSFNGKGSFEGWIKRVMINHAIDHYQKNKKHYQHTDIDKISELYIYDEDLDNSSLEVGDCSEKEMTSEIMDKAGFSHKELLEVLNNLPEPFRIVFSLHCIEHYKHEEIAELLNIDVNTSRTRLLRARKMLKQLLYKMSMERMA